MLPLNAQNVRDALIAVTVGLLALFVFGVATGHAQISVTDPPVETATAQSAQTLNQILPLDQQIETSVTTGGGAGLWQPQANYLANLNANLDQGVDTPAAFVANFPGWQALPAYAVAVAQQMSSLSLNTYAGALTAAQQQVAGFPTEDSQLAGIEQLNQGTNTVLQGQQLIVEAILALCQQVQRQRQLTAAQITMQAVHYAEELQERSAAEATTAMALNFGVAP
jgi:hypothetical protein